MIYCFNVANVPEIYLRFIEDMSQNMRDERLQLRNCEVKPIDMPIESHEICEIFFRCA